MRRRIYRRGDRPDLLAIAKEKERPAIAQLLAASQI
jgi:hypothetical protein